MLVKDQKVANEAKIYRAPFGGKPIGSDQKTAHDLENHNAGRGPTQHLTQGFYLLHMSPN
jgi:hypothetical protein